MSVTMCVLRRWLIHGDVCIMYYVCLTKYEDG